MRQSEDSEQSGHSDSENGMSDQEPHIAVMENNKGSKRKNEFSLAALKQRRSARQDKDEDEE